MPMLDLRIHPLRLSGMRRADHKEVVGVLDGATKSSGEIGGCRTLLVVAKESPEATVGRTVHNDAPWYTVGLKPAP